MRFYYGQRVRCVFPPDGNESAVGLTGTVYYACIGADSDEWISVEFDEPVWNGHLIPDEKDSTGYHGQNETGWSCEPESLIPLEEPINIEELI